MLSERDGGALMESRGSWPHIPRYSALLVALFLFLIVTPLLPLSLRGWRIVDVTISGVLIVGTLSVERRHLVPWAWGLAIPAVLLSGALHFYPSTALLFTSLAFRSTFLMLLFWVVITDVIRQRDITVDTLAGAACGYLLLGVFWAGVYAMLEVARPGSIAAPDYVPNYGGDNAELSVWFIYFSFVTLTTLGYGDVTPATAAAGMIAAMEAVFGQLYVAVLIARLVAMHAVSDK